MADPVQQQQLIRQIVAETMHEWRVAPPTPPDRKARGVRPATTEERQSNDVERDASSGWSVFIEYTDSTGRQSARRISCIRLESRMGGFPAIFAYCHEAGEPRLFRIDRINEMANCATGELLDPAEHISLLRQTGLPFTNRGMLTTGTILLFLARCDGAHHPLEWDALENGLARYAVRFDGTDDDLADTMLKLRCLAPDSSDFANALCAVVKTPASWRRPLVRYLTQTCGDIIAADKRFAAQELAWGNSLDRIFRLIG